MKRTIGIAAAAVLTWTSAPGAQQKGQQISIARVFPWPEQIGLFISNADGSAERQLGTTATTDYDATWSPDGSSIVFTSERNGSADLYRMKVDGTGVERLTDSPAYDDQASFSPDGKSLVFVTTRAGGTADLWVLDIMTRRARALTSGPGGDFRPSWSPDGRWIAFSSDRRSALPFSRGRWEHLQLADIYVIRPDGTGLRQVTRQKDFCGSPKWFPDSARLLAYCVVGQETLDIRLTKTEHAVPTRIVSIALADGAIADVSDAPGIKFNPSVMPVGRLGWLRKDGPDSGVHYSDGSIGPRGDLLTASWSPDGSRVVYHKRVPFTPRPWTPTYSRNPQYQLTLVPEATTYNPSGDRFVFVGPDTDAKGAGVSLGTPGSDRWEVVYKDPARNVLGPQWSIDGRQIIFGIGEFAAFFNGFHSEFMKAEDRAEGGAQVAIVNADGSGFHEVTTGPNNNGFPSFAPDGKRFVYRSFGPEGDGLRIMDLRTGRSTTLLKGYNNFPLWSPRGDLIMFSAQVDGDYEIYTIRPDGTGLNRLTKSRGNDAHMGWSPDGSHIVFTSTRMGFKDEAIYTDAPQPYGEIFVMKADGTDVQQITDNQWEEGTPAWRPSK